MVDIKGIIVISNPTISNGQILQGDTDAVSDTKDAGSFVAAKSYQAAPIYRRVSLGDNRLGMASKGDGDGVWPTIKTEVAAYCQSIFESDFVTTSGRTCTYNRVGQWGKKDTGGLGQR